MGVDQLKLLAARHHYTTKCCSLRKTTNNHQKIGNQQQPSTPRKPRRSLSTEAAVFDRGSRQPADTSPSPIKSQKKHRRARVREAAALALERLRGARAAALRNKTRVTEIGGELYILPRQPRGRRGGRRGVGSQRLNYHDNGAPFCCGRHHHTACVLWLHRGASKVDVRKSSSATGRSRRTRR